MSNPNETYMTARPEASPATVAYVRVHNYRARLLNDGPKDGYAHHALARHAAEVSRATTRVTFYRGAIARGDTLAYILEHSTPAPMGVTIDSVERFSDNIVIGALKRMLTAQDGGVWRLLKEEGSDPDEATARWSHLFA